jgi:hypothetical protein
VTRPGHKTIYALSALVAVLLVSAAALAASGIDIGRPQATDLPLLVARSESVPASMPLAPIAVTPPAAPAAPAASPAQAPAVSDEGGSSSAGKNHTSVAAAAPAVVAPPAPAPSHDHEVVTPPVRENDEHRTTTQNVTTPKSHD